MNIRNIHKYIPSSLGPFGTGHHFSPGETREAVPLCELRAPRSDVVGRFMEAEVSPRDWRECEVLEAASATLCSRVAMAGVGWDAHPKRKS